MSRHDLRSGIGAFVFRDKTWGRGLRGSDVTQADFARVTCLPSVRFRRRRRSPVFGLFLISGQRLHFHCAMALVTVHSGLSFVLPASAGSRSCLVAVAGPPGLLRPRADASVANDSRSKAPDPVRPTSPSSPAAKRKGQSVLPPIKVDISS